MYEDFQIRSLEDVMKFATFTHVGDKYTVHLEQYRHIYGVGVLPSTAARDLFEALSYLSKIQPSKNSDPDMDERVKKLEKEMLSYQKKHKLKSPFSWWEALRKAPEKEED